MPSRSGVTSATSAARYQAASCSWSKPGVVVGERRARLAREAPDDAADGLVDLALQLAVLRHAEARRDGDLHEATPCAASAAGARGSARTRAAARRCPWCSRAGRRRSAPARRRAAGAAAPRAPATAGSRACAANASASTPMPCADDAHRAARAAGPPADRSRTGRSQEAAHAVGEVARVVVGLEADDVRAEQPEQQLLAPLADAEDLGRRERDVPEEPDLRGRRGRRADSPGTRQRWKSFTHTVSPGAASWRTVPAKRSLTRL